MTSPSATRSLVSRLLHVVVLMTAVGVVVSACSTAEKAASASDIAPTVETLAEPVTKRVQYYTGPDADPDQHWADFTLPAGPQKLDSIPLVVLVHGGAWRMPLGAEIFNDLARDLAARGVAVYNIEYRRVGADGGWPNTFLDVARALDYVVELDAQHPQITTDDELVVGHSAGAQLAVWGGTRNKLDPGEVGAKPLFRPKRVVSLAGPLDMIQAVKDGDDRIVAALGGAPSRFPDRYRAVDPIQNLEPSIPVAALHGKNDRVVFPHNSIRYVDALKKAGGRGYLMLFDGHDHVSIVKPGTTAYATALDLVTDYSDKPIDELPAR